MQALVTHSTVGSAKSLPQSRATLCPSTKDTVPELQRPYTNDRNTLQSGLSTYEHLSYAKCSGVTERDETLFELHNVGSDADQMYDDT